MDMFRLISELKEEIGYEAFLEFIHPNNREAVSKFAQSLIDKNFPTEMTVAGVTYEIVKVAEKSESLTGQEMAIRAESKSASLGVFDLENILNYQDQIPMSIRSRKMAFIFPKCLYPEETSIVGYLSWKEQALIRDWLSLKLIWPNDVCFLRRKQK